MGMIVKLTNEYFTINIRPWPILHKGSVNYSRATRKWLVMDTVTAKHYMNKCRDQSRNFLPAVYIIHIFLWTVKQNISCTHLFAGKLTKINNRSIWNETKKTIENHNANKSQWTSPHSQKSFEVSQEVKRVLLSTSWPIGYFTNCTSLQKAGGRDFAQTSVFVSSPLAIRVCIHLEALLTNVCAEFKYF